jgi:hypothetical protein
MFSTSAKNSLTDERECDSDSRSSDSESLAELSLSQSSNSVVAKWEVFECPVKQPSVSKCGTCEPS